KNVTYLKEAQDLQQQIAKLGEKKHTSILYIPGDFYESMKVEYLSQDKPNINVQSEIKDTLNKIITDKKYEQLGISPDIRNSIKSKVIMNAKEIRADGKAEDSNTEVAMVIAMVLSILVYITLFLYGAQVMRGIIEEKSNRIVEVIISSVKPFQLMMGKIVGIGLVGLTQFALWIVVSLSLAGVASTFLISKQ